jgi:peptidoglycan/xylan/chitin deacetylase (PgdA/CDA1 family)
LKNSLQPPFQAFELPLDFSAFNGSFMYLSKTPRLVKNLLSNFTWQILTSEKVIFLTFDDGPIPEATPWVLEVLRGYNAKATFFCVGDNVRKYPEVFQQILSEGHAVGNHTFNHLKGWKTNTSDYLENVERCAEMVESPLFRPPYGALKPSQARLLKSNYRIVMWDVLSGDFDPKISPEQCLQNVLDNIQPGSIVLFHDSLKAETRMRFALPRVLEKMHAEGWRFEKLSNSD